MDRTSCSAPYGRTLHRALELSKNSWRLTGLVLGFDVDAPNTLGEQQSFHPVDMRSSFADQPAAFKVRAPQIPLPDAENWRQRPKVPLTPAPGD